MSYSASIYQVLKAIDISYEENNFNYNTTLDITKLNISKRRLELILENLFNDGYIVGISIRRDVGGNPIISTGTPRLTTAGLIFLEENSAMKKAFAILKEAKGWIPGLN